MVRVALQTMRVRRRSRPSPGCRRFLVLTDADIRNAALQMAAVSSRDPAHAQTLLRELVQLNTPALYLNIVQRLSPVYVEFRPWSGRTIRFQGRSYLLEAGSEAPEGIEAFAATPVAHITTLYPTAPDHPVHALSLEHHDERMISGRIPAWATHVTIVVNGRVITRGERLLKERGPQIWAA